MLVGNLRGKDHLKDAGADKRIILRDILENSVDRAL
jgi:hypothetical protein